MPIQIVDDFGVWDDLGTIEPAFEKWIEFPSFSYSSSQLLRLIFSAKRLDRRSFGYLRCVYQINAQYFTGRWIRIYPKFNPESIIYPHPQDLASPNTTIKRIFQIKKLHRLRRFNGSFDSDLWTVNLHVWNENLSDYQNREPPFDDFAPPYLLNLL